jgi:hypothetical protein
MREPKVRETKWGRIPVSFQAWFVRPSGLCFLGGRVKANRRSGNRNETGIFSGVTGKPSGLAPPNTVTNRRDPFNFNGLRTMAFAAEKVFQECRSPVAPLRTTHVQNRNGESRLPDALSPSCLSDSTDLLQMSKGKVLQHFMQLQHSAVPRSWSVQACAAAMRYCGRRPNRR